MRLTFLVPLKQLVTVDWKESDWVYPQVAGNNNWFGSLQYYDALNGAYCFILQHVAVYMVAFSPRLPALLVHIARKGYEESLPFLSGFTVSSTCERRSANTDPEVYYPYPFKYYPRSLTTFQGSVSSNYSDGTSILNGQYRILGRALKTFGDRENPQDWQFGLSNLLVVENNSTTNASISALVR